MLKNFVPREHVTEITYSLNFMNTDKWGGVFGCSFPCDKDGNVFPLENEAARKNLAHCLEHVGEYEIHGVQRNERTITEPAHGTCHCGSEVYLFNLYMGACQCPECGRWYNLFGQELVDPKYWDED